MAKNHWFAMYPGDYMRDTQSLSTRQHGAYCLLMLTYYATGGPLPDDDTSMARITRMSLGTWLKERPSLERFFQIQNGFWIHKRINSELLKTSAISEIAKEKAAKRWKITTKPDAGAHAAALPVDMPGTCYPQPQPQPQGTKHERERSADRPSWGEVELHATRIGLAQWKARDWFDEMEGCGWLDFQHRPIEKWQPVLNRVRTKWEADGRPDAPPSAAGSRTGQQSGNTRAMTPLDLKTIIAAKEVEANALKGKYASETAMDLSWSDQSKRTAWQQLRKEIRDLNSKLAKMA